MAKELTPEARLKKAARFHAWEVANRERRNAYKKALREANPSHYKEKSAKRAAQYRADHPEEWAAYIKAHREAPEQREKAKAYWSRSGEKKKTQRKEAREALPPPVYSDDPKKIKAREYMREWTAKNYERVREQKTIVENNRRAKKKSGGHFTQVEWRAVCAQQNGLCFDCGERRRLTVGHLVPLSKGGPNVIGNIVAQCMPCNLKQHGNIHHSVSGS